MGACVEVECPKCHQKFVISPSLLGAGYELHCPFCNHYFPEQEAAGMWGQPPAGFSTHKG